MRHVWSALTSIFAAAILALEIPALRKPKPADPKDDHTYTGWWRWLVGVDPQHWRRFILGPLFVGFWAWFTAHVVARIGPSLRFGPGRASR